MAGEIPLGAPIWVDSTTPDLAGDTAFYAGLFGWSARDYGEEFGHYTELLLGGDGDEGRSVAGIVPGEAPGRWHLSFHVADCEAAAARAEKLGGAVVEAPAEVGGDMKFAMLADPNGAEFGLLQPIGEGPGFKAYQEPRAASWFEYNYDGVPAEAMRFYADLLGWSVVVPPWTDPKDPRPYAALSAEGGKGEFGG
ncbi:VOC family protein, partial [Glycomyces tenuis]